MADVTAPRPYVPAFSGIYAAFDPIALPLLRLTMGLILFPHGCQKLFGWFGGLGFEKFTEIFDKIGWHRRCSGWH
jgi:putative oxidoreductase